MTRWRLTGRPLAEPQEPLLTREGVGDAWQEYHDQDIWTPLVLPAPIQDPALSTEEGPE